jgi:glycosyltransferase involved in cell wall biosynthesis
VLDTLRRRRSFARQLRRLCDEADLIISRSHVLTDLAGRALPRKPLVFVHANAIATFSRESGYGQTRTPGRLGRLKRLAQARWAAWQEASAMRRSDVLVYLSDSRRRATLKGHFQRHAHKARVIPPGVDLQRFTPPESPRATSGPLRLLSVCRLSPEKNLSLVADALYLLRRRGTIAFWDIAGDGPAREQLARQVHGLKLTQQVRFLGRISDVETAYRQADLFVLPSTYEGFGHVYAEALASGLGCIALSGRKTGLEVAADEIIRHDRTGWLLDRNDADLLADVLLELTRDRRRLARWHSEARLDAENRFHWVLSIKRLLQAAGAEPPAATDRKEQAECLKRAS